MVANALVKSGVACILLRGTSHRLLRGNLVGPMWMHVNHGRKVLWKGLIVDMMLGKNHLSHTIIIVDIGPLGIKCTVDICF